MKVMVIIPAYNEEGSIEHVIHKICLDYPEADYIVINDCSTDKCFTDLKSESRGLC